MRKNKFRNGRINSSKRNEIRHKDEYDMSSEEYWENLAEDDEISVAEAAFMHGYLNA